MGLMVRVSTGTDVPPATLGEWATGFWEGGELMLEI